MSAAGICLSDPKSGVSTLFPYHAAPTYMCSASEPFLGATITDSLALLSLQGDILPYFSLFTPTSTPICAKVCDSSAVLPTKGDVFTTFLAASVTKGDESNAFLAASATKGDVYSGMYAQGDNL